MTLEEWTRAGGWYRDEFMLLYRPTGHDDPFLRAWINLTAAVGPSPGASQTLQIFAELTGRNAPGQCGKCHSVDATVDGELLVNWRPKLRTMEPELYTKYQHQPPFSLLDEAGCLTCHQVDYESDVMASYRDLNPSTFARNFKPMSKTLCARCHEEEQAGNACTDCHNYHVGRFPPALSAAPLALSGMAEEAPPQQ